MLLFLAKKGALRLPVRITTVEIGSMLGMSQQNASVRLRALEEGGLVSREGCMVGITAEGEKCLRSYLSELRRILEPESIMVRGRIVHGFDEGKFYMSLPGYKRQMERKLGFVPYPGTLNLELLPEFVEKRVELRSFRHVSISGFEHKGKSYGPIEAYRCRVGGIDGAVIFPRRSHHGLSVIEVIAPVYLMGELRLKFGDELDVEVFLH